MIANAMDTNLKTVTSVRVYNLDTHEKIVAYYIRKWNENKCKQMLQK